MADNATNVRFSQRQEGKFKGNWVMEFDSPINIDDGHRNHPQGTMPCSMELFTNDNGTPTLIEWVAGKNEDFVEHIGLEFDGKTLEGYDGVFDFPAVAKRLINKVGYTVPKEFTDFS